MFIQTEETPNPSTIKFLPGRIVYAAGSVEFTNEQEATKAPLAKSLFDIQGVANVLFGNDFIAVSKTEAYEWFTIKPQVLEKLVHYLSSHAAVEVFKDESETTDPKEHDAISREIIELLDNRIRPAVAMDGGDIIFQSFEDGVVYLKMKGACSGCPSSSITLKSGIENMLRYYIPEVTEVRAVE